jgi:hypothetical protein
MSGYSEINKFQHAANVPLKDFAYIFKSQRLEYFSFLTDVPLNLSKSKEDISDYVNLVHMGIRCVIIY